MSSSTQRNNQLAPGSHLSGGLLSSIRALWVFVGRRRFLQLCVLLAFMVASAFAEVVSIGAVIPFITVIAEPDSYQQSGGWASTLTGLLGFNRRENMLLPLTVIFIAAVVIASLLRLIVIWGRSQLATAMGVQLRTTLYSYILQQPYQYHVNQNTSKLISLVTEKSGAAINAAFMQVLAMIHAILLALAVTAALVYLNPYVAAISFAALAICYTVIVSLIRRRIRSNGQIIARNQSLAIKLMQEGVGGIRDVIMAGSHGVFISLYRGLVKKNLSAQYNNAFLGEIPRPVLEMIGITLIAILAYSLQSDGNSSYSSLPTLAAFAVAAQRLLPSLQQIFLSWTIIHGAEPVIAEIVDHLKLAADFEPVTTQLSKLPFNKSIKLENVSFRYPGRDTDVLKQVKLTIEKGQRIGLVGSTGSGKSTLVDIIMGLLEPRDGCIEIDGQPLRKDQLANWRCSIAHVPQSVFLSDSPLYANIAFGVDPLDIDMEKVRDAAGKAQISSFIESLHSGYETSVGERGMRLSGGQRQRIGIARALYRRADLIVLDEATSALDDHTESLVMESISALDSDVTVLVVAHRSNTLNKCDVVYSLRGGQLTDITIASKDRPAVDS